MGLTYKEGDVLNLVMLSLTGIKIILFLKSIFSVGVKAE
ncbi:hypothetical protein SPWS13_2480 [Shewanella putrefaciens]|nr:hypothetical protein SPWS13_2480 [Shewanella putrefaciens]